MTSTSNQLRQAFLDYFAKNGHEVVPSSSLIPGNDPTLLFTNAGMVQFKDVFLGREKRAIPRAASAQRCVRAGGKHNDLENVGLHGAASHVFRDARQFQLRRLLQARRYPLRVGIHHEGSRPTVRAALVHRVRGRRRGRVDLAQRDRRRQEPVRAARHVGQLLGDGRHGPVWAVQRDLLRPRPRSRRGAAGLAD